MLALVTGAAGFIGSFLVPSLTQNGYTVRALLMPHEDGSHLETQGVDIFRGDLTQPETMTGIAKDVDIVFHLAGRVVDWGRYKDFHTIMVDGTRNLLQACQGAGIQRFVYFSSFGALGLNRDLAGLDETAERVRTGIPYCDTKIEAEDLVADYCPANGIAYTIIRPANVIGPGSVWVRDVLDAFHRGPMPLIAGGKKAGAFICVENLVDGVLLAASSEKAVNRTYHFRDDTGLTWGEYITTLGGWIGKKPFGSVPFGLAYRLGAVSEKLLALTSLRPHVTRLAAGIMGCDNDVDVGRARTELGWVSKVSADEAMAKIKTWVESRYRPAGTKTIKDFHNRLIYITGGSSGIGLEVACQLAARGGHIVLLARDAEKLDAAGRKVEAARRSSHQRVAGISMDVSDLQDVMAKLGRAVAEFGPPDILINSAGVLHNDHFEDTDFETFDRVIQTNLYGVRKVTSALLPVMKEKGGQIVIIGSLAGLLGVYGYTAYGTSKFAVVGFAECLRSELKPLGIPVTLICPPEVTTPMIAEEARTISPQAKAVKKITGVLTPQYAARKIIKAISKRRFLVIPGLRARLAYMGHCLTLGLATRMTSDLLIRYKMKKGGDDGGTPDRAFVLNKMGPDSETSGPV